MTFRTLVFFFLMLGCFACEPNDPIIDPGGGEGDPEISAVIATFEGRIDLDDPFNYGSQPVPGYVNRDNIGGNPIVDATATLGRVLFYDVELSANRTISCASCHRQELAFGDDAVASVGVSGTTGRHGMRLTNARFGEEVRFFWDERANTLEEQTTQPIQDHIEMGFSGEDDDPSFADLIDRLAAVDYYGELFTYAFGNAEITEDKMQRALAQFIRSMQSFDSKYDAGRAQVNNNNAPFPNFTQLENNGKTLFSAPADFNGAGVRVGGGFGCAGCHQAPEFSIDPRSDNNGVIGMLSGGGQDLTVTRSPSLRDVFLPNGLDNGPFMHTGSFATINEVLNHYNRIPQNNADLDRRLRPGGNPQQLNMAAEERAAVIAFLQTLSGSAIFTDERWSDPF